MTLTRRDHLLTWFALASVIISCVGLLILTVAALIIVTGNGY